MHNLYDIKLQEYTVSFPYEQGVVVHPVSYIFKQGEITALIGESGSGKSVLGKSLVKLLDAASYGGKALYKGEDISKKDFNEMCEMRGRDIFFIPQDPMSSLNPSLTIGAQLMEILEFHHNEWGDLGRQKILNLLLDLGFDEPDRIFNSYSFQMSGGMNQRIICAMALLMRPKWIIADEPTKGLDSTVYKQMVEMFLQLQTQMGFGMILITHDLRLVKKLATSFLLLKQGYIVESGLVEDNFKNPQSNYLKQLLLSQTVFSSQWRERMYNEVGVK